ncbi:MAG: M20/M25/M40 family metallo-hydrolase [Solirubrobacteraceae bacterium]
MRLAGDAQREQLHATFTALCRIESPSGRERVCADRVSAELRQAGVEVSEDDSGEAAGSDAGNLLARIAGRGSASILLCAHLDTVALSAPVEPVCVNGGWENAHEGILGADNKAAVAVMLTLARALAGDPEPPEVGVELLFTVGEEVGLRGASEFDVARLRSRLGYVFDHASPIGEVVLGSPTLHRIVADFQGRAAHAGIRPQDGRSAIVAAARAVATMHLGRLDAHTTANVGTISGGTSTNVVPERCRLEAEARSLDESRVEALVTEMVDHLQDAADASECDLDVTTRRLFKGYRTRAGAAQITLAERALSACGYQPKHIVTGGGSDANALQAKGFPCANLADGTERNHEPGERISFDALEGMLRVATALVHEAGGMEELYAPGKPGRPARGRGEGWTRRTGRKERIVNEFEYLGQETNWEGTIVRVGSERFRHADGEEVTREKVWHPGAVGIVALDATHVWLTRQPRETVRASASLEVPAGKLDVAGEPPLAAAKRELAEEIGKRAAVWQEIKVFYTSPGFSDERVWLYLAQELSAAPGAQAGGADPGAPAPGSAGAEPEENERIEIVPWPLDCLEDAIAECDDSKSLIALLWLIGGGVARHRAGAAPPPIKASG